MESGGKRDNPVGMQPRTWVRVVETPAGSASAVTVPRPANWRRSGGGRRTCQDPTESVPGGRDCNQQWWWLQWRDAHVDHMENASHGVS